MTVSGVKDKISPGQKYLKSEPVNYCIKSELLSIRLLDAEIGSP